MSRKIQPISERTWGRKREQCKGGCWSAYDERQPELGQIVDSGFYEKGLTTIRPSLLTGVTFDGYQDGEIHLSRGDARGNCASIGLVWHPAKYDAKVCCAIGLNLQGDWWKMATKSEKVENVDEQGVVDSEISAPEDKEVT